MSEPLRLSKRLIELTGCSRREAELYIEGGWVTVDGQVIEAPQFKVTDQRVELLPGAVAEPLAPVTLLLHLPAGAGTSPEALRELLRSEMRWAEDPSGLRLLRGHFARLTIELPLQPGASGLAIFTQDWRTQRKLKADAGKLEQEYLVEVSGQARADGLERLRRGQVHKGRTLPPCKASWQSETRLRLPLKNPPPGLVKALCASIGLQVEAMKRLRVGGVPMGKLPIGQWRYLGPGERF